MKGVNIMESYKSNTATEIEKLKKKVIAYKNLLTTLKLGVSLEDYLLIKGEFEELKKQMAEIQLLKEDVAKEPADEIDPSEVKQVSNQLSSLNQMVEEVLFALNKISVDEVKKEEVKEETVSPQLTNIKEISELKSKGNKMIKQPSYNQLRSLAGQVIYRNNSEEVITIENNEQSTLQVEQQHRVFNKHYFQSINNQQNNGLFNMKQVKTPTRPTEIGKFPNWMNGKIYEQATSPKLPNAPGYRGLQLPPQIHVKKPSRRIRKAHQADKLVPPSATPTLVEEVQLNTEQQFDSSLTSIKEEQEVVVTTPMERTSQTEFQLDTTDIVTDKVDTTNSIEETEVNINQQFDQPAIQTEQEAELEPKNEERQVEVSDRILEAETAITNEVEETEATSLQQAEQLTSLATEEEQEVDLELSINELQSEEVSNIILTVETAPMNETAATSLQQAEQLTSLAAEEEQEAELETPIVEHLSLATDESTIEIHTAEQQNELATELDKTPEQKKQWGNSFFNFFRKK